MGKSNFLKTFSRGKISPYFQKVIFNIMLLLMAVSISSITVSAQEEKEETDPVVQEVQEVTSSIPEIQEELSDINYKMDDMQILLAEDITQLQETNSKLDSLIVFNGYIFAALLMVIICILFIAIYRLFNRYFRF